MNSSNVQQNMQFVMRRSHRSWSLSDASDSAKNSLTTVDEEEMFLFDDEDLNRKSRSKGVGKTDNAMDDFDPEGLDFSSEIPPMSEMDLPKKTEITAFHKRYFIYDGGKDIIRAASPNQLDLLGSSAESEKSSISIEGLRDHLHSCFTCGVLWREDQTSLDCHECGGYSLDRPCPECDGNCRAVWIRDLTSSHQFSKAKWIGKCARANSLDDGNECSPLI